MSLELEPAHEQFDFVFGALHVEGRWVEGGIHHSPGPRLAHGGSAHAWHSAHLAHHGGGWVGVAPLHGHGRELGLGVLGLLLELLLVLLRGVLRGIYASLVIISLITTN